MKSGTNFSSREVKRLIVRDVVLDAKVRWGFFIREEDEEEVERLQEENNDGHDFGEQLEHFLEKNHPKLPEKDDAAKSNEENASLARKEEEVTGKELSIEGIAALKA